MIISSTSHLFSCFCIKSEGGVGTAFACQTDGRTFFLTALHVLGGSRAGGFVFFKTPTSWERHEITGVTAHPQGHDAATFGVVGLAVSVSHEIAHPDDPGLSLGQEVKFTGFPHGLENTAASHSGYSTPLVRTAFFSGVIVDPTHGRRLLILDGLNNPGYSGAPVWSPGYNTSHPSLLGLISGYRVEDRGKSRVFREINHNREEVMPDLFVKPNSGMIHAIAYSDLKYLIDNTSDTNC